MKRRTFLIASGLAWSQTLPDGFPAQPASLVKEIVGAAHFNAARVRELLKIRPALVNACWDWGFGDWETPLGAASHVGNREIATALLDAGATPTVFSAAMLGQLDVVKAMIAAQPGLEAATGAHSISLLAHAKGPVLAYLQTVPGAGGLKVVELSEEQLTKLPGEFGADIAVTRKDKQLSFQRKGGTPRMIHHLGNLAFRPAGATAVRIRFREDFGSLLIEDGELKLELTRR